MGSSSSASAPVFVWGRNPCQTVAMSRSVCPPRLSYSVFLRSMYSSRGGTSDSDRTRNSKDRNVADNDGDKLQGNSGAAAACSRPTHRDVSNWQHQTRAEGVSDQKIRGGKRGKTAVASGSNRGTSKSRVDKSSKEKVAANGRETTDTNLIKTNSSKAAVSSTVRSSKTPANEKLEMEEGPSTKQGSASPNVGKAKEDASAKSICPLSTSAVGKNPCPKPRTQCTTVDIS